MLYYDQFLVVMKCDDIIKYFTSWENISHLNGNYYWFTLVGIRIERFIFIVQEWGYIYGSEKGEYWPSFQLRSKWKVCIICLKWGLTFRKTSRNTGLKVVFLFFRIFDFRDFLFGPLENIALYLKKYYIDQ